MVENQLESILSDPSALASVPLDKKLALASTLKDAIARDRAQQVGAVVQAGCDADELLTVHEAAARLKVTPRWLYRHARKLPFARKLSRKILRFSRAALERWVERQRS